MFSSVGLINGNPIIVDDESGEKCTKIDNNSFDFEKILSKERASSIKPKKTDHDLSKRKIAKVEVIEKPKKISSDTKKRKENNDDIAKIGSVQDRNNSTKKRKVETDELGNPPTSRPTQQEYKNYQDVQHIKNIICPQKIENTAKVIEFKEYLRSVKQRSKGRELNTFIERLRSISEIAQNNLWDSVDLKRKNDHKDFKYVNDAVTNVLRLLSPNQEGWLTFLDSYFQVLNKRELKAFVHDLAEIEDLAKHILSERYQKKPMYGNNSNC